MKKLCCILFDDSSNPVLEYKDVGMILYGLQVGHDYSVDYVCFGENSIGFSDRFNKSVNFINISSSLVYSEQIKKAIRFIKENICNYDVLMMFNYGKVNYKLAKLAKKYNSKIVVYCKLDMSFGGFNHFYENNNIRVLKNKLERHRSRCVDFFTVENRDYYNKLCNNKMFKNRMHLLYNGVSLVDADISKIEKNPKEKNIIYVGRLGAYPKNTEFFLEVIKKLVNKIDKEWKIYICGPFESGFEKKVEEFYKSNDILKNKVIFTGNISDREHLYTLYQRSRIYCSTSISEGCTIAGLEAIYFGCYPILTNFGSTVWTITNKGAFGEIIEQGDIDSYVEAVYNATLKDDLGECKIKNYAKDNFDYSIVCEKLNDLLEKYSNEKLCKSSCD